MGGGGKGGAEKKRTVKLGRNKKGQRKGKKEKEFARTSVKETERKGKYGGRGKRVEGEE